MASNMKQLTKFICNTNNIRLLHTRVFLTSHKPFSHRLLQHPLKCTSVDVVRSAVALSSTSSNSSKQNKEENEETFRYKTEKERRKMGVLYIVWTVSATVLGSSSYLLYQRLHPAKAEKAQAEASSKASSNEIESGSLHKSDAGFKERKIIEYENRIRAYSTPDKTFRYFASLQDSKSGVIYMNPEDFVRALTPDTLQPKGLGLDQFKKFDHKNATSYGSKHFGIESIFHSLGGLISFSDYIFLLTVLGTSARHIEIAFKMFDIDGDGKVSPEEFRKVSSMFLNMSSTGSRHRDRKTTGNVKSEKSKVNAGLATYFFGVDGSGVLTFEKFLKFKRTLQEEVMYLEFNSFVPKDDTITERQFVEILLTYANFPKEKRKKIMRRVKKVYRNKVKGVKFVDYLAFFKFLINLRDVEMALSFHTIAGQAIDKATFKQVAKTVTQVDLSDHIIDIVFCIFDENEDDKLSNREFVAVMKDKMLRGLSKHKDTGFTRLLGAMVTCTKINASEYWFSSKSS